MGRHAAAVSGKWPQSHETHRCEFDAASISDVPAAMQSAGAWLRDEQRIRPTAVGHRVVHGGPEYDNPILINEQVLARLERYVPLAPLHPPHNLAPIRSILTDFPELPQVACFDTAFHRNHSAAADHYLIPQHLHAEGVRRYGFHGLSYPTHDGLRPDDGYGVKHARTATIQPDEHGSVGPT
jgi:acetate kinase